MGRTAANRQQAAESVFRKFDRPEHLQGDTCIDQWTQPVDKGGRRQAVGRLGHQIAGEFHAGQHAGRPRPGRVHGRVLGQQIQRAHARRILILDRPVTARMPRTHAGAEREGRGHVRRQATRIERHAAHPKHGGDARRPRRLGLRPPGVLPQTGEHDRHIAAQQQTTGPRLAHETGDCRGRLMLARNLARTHRNNHGSGLRRLFADRDFWQCLMSAR